jgi:hypothetical protein
MNRNIKRIFEMAGGFIEESENEVLTYTEHFDVERFAKLLITDAIHVGGCGNHGLRQVESYFGELDIKW